MNTTFRDLQYAKRDFHRIIHFKVVFPSVCNYPIDTTQGFEMITKALEDALKTRNNVSFAPTGRFFLSMLYIYILQFYYTL